MRKSKLKEGESIILITDLQVQMKKIFSKDLPDQRHIAEMLYQNRLKIRELEENENALAMLLSLENARSIFNN